MRINFRARSKKSAWLIGVLVFIPMLFAFKASAFVMSSSNYRLEKDSINIGGTEESASASYLLSDTLGETGTGTSTSASFKMNAGYRQMDETYLSMSVPDAIALSPSIGGLTGGTASGNGTWNVKTDSASGYTMTIKAGTDPAMKSAGDSISDYSPASAGTPDYGWELTGADAEFGFSPYNAQSQAAKFKNNSSACAIGTGVTDGACWYGLSTAYEAIASKSGRTEIGGEDTKINFQAEIAFQVSGNYSAEVVVTASSN